MTLSILESGPAFGCERPPFTVVVFVVVVVVVVVVLVYFHSIMLLGNKSA